MRTTYMIMYEMIYWIINKTLCLKLTHYPTLHSFTTLCNANTGNNLRVVTDYMTNGSIYTRVTIKESGF